MRQSCFGNADNCTGFILRGNMAERLLWCALTIAAFVVGYFFGKRRERKETDEWLGLNE